MKETLQIEESTEYENCLDIKQKSIKENTLLAFMDIDDDEIESIIDEEWKLHWKGMPSFTCDDNAPFKRLVVNFRNEEDFLEFSRLIDQPNIMKSRSIWHPKRVNNKSILMRWMEEDDIDEE